MVKLLLDFRLLYGMYSWVDVALVTSLRDGMNLVSYEYVACQNLKNTEGVLVLSEVRLLPSAHRPESLCIYGSAKGNIVWCLIILSHFIMR